MTTLNLPLTPIALQSHAPLSLSLEKKCFTSCTVFLMELPNSTCKKTLTEERLHMAMMACIPVRRGLRWQKQGD